MKTTGMICIVRLSLKALIVDEDTISRYYLNNKNVQYIYIRLLKGVFSLISSDPFCKDDNAQFTTVTLKT